MRLLHTRAASLAYSAASLAYSAASLAYSADSEIMSHRDAIFRDYESHSSAIFVDYEIHRDAILRDYESHSSATFGDYESHRDVENTEKYRQTWSARSMTPMSAMSCCRMNSFLRAATSVAPLIPSTTLQRSQ